MASILVVIADSASPSGGDNTVRVLLEDLGHTVTFRSDETAEDVTGFGGVAICESVTSATVSTKYSTVAIPVVFLEPGVLDDMGFCPTVDISSTASQTQITWIQPTHAIQQGPFGAAFSGTDTIMSSAQTLGWFDVTNKASGVVQIAEIVGSTGDNIPLAAAEAGATLLSPINTAPARRVFFGLNDPNPAVLTADGRNALRNCFYWAFGNAVNFPTTGILDAADRADEDPIAGIWQCPMYVGDRQLRVSSNQIATHSVDGYGNSYINYPSYGPNVEIYVTLKSTFVSGARVYLDYRASLGGGGYRARFSNDTGDHHVWFYKDGLVIDDKDVADDEFTIDGTFGAGMTDSTMTAYYRPAGGTGWFRIGSTVDVTYSGAGYLALAVEGGTAMRVDDVGGGTVGGRIADKIRSLSWLS